MHKHHISLTRHLVAGNKFGTPVNGHRFLYAQYNPLTHDSNQSPQGESILLYVNMP